MQTVSYTHLWLDGVEKKYVEEVGSMNIMFKIDGEIYTAPCVGTVLARGGADVLILDIDADRVQTLSLIHI